MGKATILEIAKMPIIKKILLVAVLCFVSHITRAMNNVNEPPPEIVLALGAANVLDRSKYAGYGLEYRFLPVWRKLQPTVGYSITLEHDQYVYIGVHYFFELNDLWRLNPSFAIGLFHPGYGIKLGGNVEFRSGFEFSRRISERVRIGLGFSHISNSRIYQSNPGTETAELSLAITL
jgi:hypothetical protein